jgi:methionyl-tRNA formyltransferase
MRFGSIHKLVLLGGSMKLIEAARHAKENGLDVHVFTSKRLLGERVLNGGVFSAVLEKERVTYHVSDDINADERLWSLVDEHTLGVSVGSPWIIKKDTIELFNGKLVNSHSSRLPKGAGGGGFSWAILMGERKGACTLHIIDEGTDTGDILIMRKFTYPLSCKKPIDYASFELQEHNILFRQFIDGVKAEKVFLLKRQNARAAEYWPRLNTDINGYIDWSWDAEHILNFINAFDDPYKGASTFVGGKRVHLKDSTLHHKRAVFHPFQSGLVFRKHEGTLFIAAPGGALAVGVVTDKAERDIIDTIKPGDRFATPSELLDAAAHRVSYTPQGLKS